MHLGLTSSASLRGGEEVRVGQPRPSFNIKSWKIDRTPKLKYSRSRLEISVIGHGGGLPACCSFSEIAKSCIQHTFYLGHVS